MANRTKTRRRMSYGGKTALGMLFPPLGLTLLWNRRCRWPQSTKIAISAVMCAVFLALLAFPSPSNARSGGIAIKNTSIEVYGPEMPARIESGYAYVSTDTSGSVVSTAAQAMEDATTYVYASDDQSCYHLYTCKFAYASGQRLTLYEATFLGYTPCPRCQPPVYGAEPTAAPDSEGSQP